MAGSGELYKGTDGKWAFRVKAGNGKVVALNDPPGYKAKSEARAVLQKLLNGDYKGPIREPAAVSCGQEITANTTLDGDLSCSGDGPALIVTADNIILDLGGFTVSGGGPSSAEHPGILLRNVKGVTVRKGTVKGFGAGVAIAGGANNVIENLTVEDNIGGGTVATISVGGTSASGTEPPKVQQAARRYPDGVPRMNISERQQKVLITVLECGEVGPSTVADQLEISVSTAYRDLSVLEEHGLVQAHESGKRIISPLGKDVVEAIVSAWVK